VWTPDSPGATAQAALPGNGRAATSVDPRPCRGRPVRQTSSFSPPRRGAGDADRADDPPSPTLPPAAPPARGAITVGEELQVPLRSDYWDFVSAGRPVRGGVQQIAGQRRRAAGRQLSAFVQAACAFPAHWAGARSRRAPWVRLRATVALKRTNLSGLTWGTSRGGLGCRRRKWSLP